MTFRRKPPLIISSLFLALFSLLVGTGLAVAPSIASGSTAATTVMDSGTNTPWSGSETPGSAAYDTMTLTGDGVATPTGTVTYSFFTNGTCSTPANSTDPVSIGADGTVPASSPTGPLGGGSYSFDASYPGDGNNAPVTSACESFTVPKATPGITLTVYGNGVATPDGGTIVDTGSGASIYMTATLQGTNGLVPTGTVDFIASTSSACGQFDLGAVPLSNGAATSQTFTGLGSGSYAFSARYNGDGSYSTVSSTCVTITVAAAAAPIVTTNPQNENAVVGGSLTFTAGASGTPTPTVQWQASVDGGATWITLPGATSNTLSIGSVASIENGWLFRAVFTNPTGSAITSTGVLGVIPVTSILVPSTTASFSGTQTVDASATSGVNQVLFEVTGGQLTNKVVATSSLTVYGWVASWNTANVPNGTYTLRSVASFSGGPLGTSTGVTVTVSNSGPTTSILMPSNNSNLSGTSTLDASASSGTGSVQFEVTGGPLTGQIVATASSTQYGWLASWDTTNVPNGTYTLQSVAAYFAGGVSGVSSGITVTVNNSAPTTAVVLPANGASLTNLVWFDASASSSVTHVVYTLTGGSFNGTVVATATATIYGWLAAWNTASVPDGTYTLKSVASYAGGVSGTSSGVTITVAN